MTIAHAPLATAARLRREHQRRSQDRTILARRHAEFGQCMRQLVQLVDRLDESGPDPHSRRLAAAIVDQMDELLPDVLLRESRALLSASTPPADAWTQQATEHLRADHGWISGNWCELRPLIDGVACGQSWVDPDRLRDAAELFCALQREHAALATTLLERRGVDVDADDEAPLVAAH